MKKSIGWHIAGTILAVILFLVAVILFALGVYAFETAEYPAVGGYALYAVKSDLIPTGAAVVADLEKTPERGMPVAYAEESHICVKYYYGTEEDHVILTDAESENPVEIAPEALRGVAVSSVGSLGTLLRYNCSLAGVCIHLGVSIVLVFLIGFLAAALLKRVRYNRTLPEDAGYLAEETEKTDDIPRVRITANLTMKQLDVDENGRVGVMFFGNVTNILKLAQLIRTLAEKMQTSAVTVEERYDDTCGLYVELDEQELPFLEAIIKLLREREEQKPMDYMEEISVREDESDQEETEEN